MAIKLVVADDHQIVRRGLRALFAADRGIKVIGEASSGREAIRITARLRPDVLLLDLQMEELGGLEALRVLKDRAPQTRVVIFTMHYSCVFAAQALENGAMGYVLKGCPDSDLIKAVRGAVEGKVFLSGPVKDVALRAYMAEAETGGFDPHDTLTARQREVLQMSAEGLTSTQIGKRLRISYRTVENHRAMLMRRLGLHNHTDLVRHAIDYGLIPPND